MSDRVQETAPTEPVDPILGIQDPAPAPIVPVGEPAADAEVAPVHDAGAPTEPPRSGTTFESLAIAGFIFGMFAIVIALFALGLAARAVTEKRSGGGGGSSSSASTSSTALDLVLADFSIDPDKASISQGGTITLTNEGAVQHDLVVEGERSKMIDAGDTATLTLETTAPGTYTAYCSVPGHREAGMEATITVE